MGKTESCSCAVYPRVTKKEYCYMTKTVIVVSFPYQLHNCVAILRWIHSFMGRKWQAWKTSFQQKKTTASGTNTLKWTWFLQWQKPSALSPSPRWHITLNCYPDQLPFIQNLSCAELCDKLISIKLVGFQVYGKDIIFGDTPFPILVLLIFVFDFVFYWSITLTVLC